MADLIIDPSDVSGTTRNAAWTVELTDLNGVPVVGSSMTGEVVRLASGTGSKTLDVIPNADITPANTYYTVSVGGFVRLIEKSSASQRWLDALADDPVPLDSAALGPVNARLDQLETDIGVIGDPTTAALGGKLTGTVGNAGVAAGGIGTPELAALGTTTAKLADGAATRPKIATGAVDEARLRPLLDRMTRGSADVLSRWNALWPGATTYACHCLIVSDSTTRHMWSKASAGTIIEWVQLMARAIRNFGVPATADVRFAADEVIGGQPTWWTTTGTVTPISKGLGCGGLRLSSGATATMTFGGSTEALWDPIPGDGCDVYGTKSVSGDGSMRVALDGNQIAQVSMNDATGGAILGHNKIASTGKTDGALHTVVVTAVGGPVTLDLGLVHHGTISAGGAQQGVILWNGALNGSAPQTHMDGGGFQDALRQLSPALTVIGNGATAWFGDHSGATYRTGLETMIDYIQAQTASDVIIGSEPEFAGFDLTGAGTLSSGTVWAGMGAVHQPIARDVAEAKGCGLVQLGPALGSSAGVALTTGGVDVFTRVAPLAGNDLVHVNQLGQDVYFNEYGRVMLSARVASVAAVASGGGAGAVSSVAGKTGVVTLVPADAGAAAASHTQSLSTITSGDLTLPVSGGYLRVGEAFGIRFVSFFATGAATQPTWIFSTDGSQVTTFLMGPGGTTAPTTAYARSALGLGTAATTASTAYEVAGAAAAAQTAATSASQPVDSDLTAIAALSTTSFGRDFLALVDAAAARTKLGLGTVATTAATAYQPVNANLTALAAVASQTAGGRALLASSGIDTDVFMTANSATKIAPQSVVKTWTDAISAATYKLVNAKGDVLGGTADDTLARLAVGSNGQVLTADSTAATGLKWAAGGGGVASVVAGAGVSVDATVPTAPVVSLNQGSAPNALVGSPALSAWYKADAQTGYSDGDLMSTIVDSSGGGLDLSGSGAARATYKAASSVPWWNGKPTMRFSGAQVMTKTSTGLSAATTWSVAAVVYKVGDTDNNIVFSGAGTGVIRLVWESRRPTFQIGTGPSNAAAGQWGWESGQFIVVGIFDGAIMHLYINDRLVSHGPATVGATPTDISLGAFSAGGYPFSGDICEAALYRAALTQAQRIALTRHLAAKWGVGVAAPL